MDNHQKARLDQLFALGLIFNGVEYIKDDFNMHWSEIMCDNTEMLKQYFMGWMHRLNISENAYQNHKQAITVIK